MLFSSITFLYYFLPILLIIYFIVPSKYKNLVLLCFSLIFYFFGEPVYILLLIGSSLSGYIHGRLIDASRHTPYARVWLISSIVVGLGLLGFFKYSNFFIDNINILFGTEITPLAIVLPLGISFYTFQILSYTIDLYRKEVAVQKNPIDFMTYVSLFPQLIAGPIVRYHTIEHALQDRKSKPEDIRVGVKRFMTGLGKKVLIADTLGEIGLHFQQAQETTVVFYWLYAIAFTLQIYFDFSGYSDMAIGLGRIFGFRFLENFNYPYISRSITEFWRRWHISLGQWFKRYLYIPLGGNRVDLKRFLFNITIVWFATGLWHGAAWNFIIWGLYYGALLLLEKLVLRRYLEKTPNVLRHTYVILITIFGMTMFNAGSLSEGFRNIGGMLLLSDAAFINAETVYVLRNYAVILLLAAITATPVFRLLKERLEHMTIVRRGFAAIEPALLVLLLLLVSGTLIDGSFNPFIYFRF